MTRSRESGVQGKIPTDSERKLNKKPVKVDVVVVAVSAGPVVVSVKISALLTRREGASSLERLVSSSLSQAETMAAIARTLKKIRNSLLIYSSCEVTSS